MKKIINGRKYDTETAEQLADWTINNPGDLSYVEEELYRKKTGEYFLHGHGGPASKYAVRIEQNTWTGGEKITPITAEEAREITELQLTCEEYEAVWGEIAE